MLETYNLRITGYDPDRKINAILAIRNLTGTGLVGSMNLLASVPCDFLVNAPQEEVDLATMAFDRAGVTFAVTGQSLSPVHDPQDGSNSD